MANFSDVDDECSRACVVYNECSQAWRTCQYSEIVRSKRINNVGRECLGIIKYFKQRQEEDCSNYFAVDFGDDGIVRSVFWAVGRARSAYLQFFDVLVFDLVTTYKINKLRMPVVSSTGVNNHQQSILFGGALSSETFVWLFT